MSNICIIIPSHDRHNYLNRCISYYKNFPCRIVICDSSEDRLLETFPKNIFYYHLPGKKFSEKILFAISIAPEDFLALVADDDFLFEDAIGNAFQCLVKNPNIQACVGDVLTFDESPPFR